MSQDIYDEINAMIRNARREYLRNPDYIVIGSNQYLDVITNDKAMNFFSYRARDCLTLFGIEILRSLKQNELCVVYKSPKDNQS